MKDIQPLFNLWTEHGESPVWDEEKKIFYWVDLLKGRFHRASLYAGNPETFDVGQPLGVLALRAKGGLVLALQNGFAFYDDNEYKVIPIADPEAGLPETRFNDGAIDPLGRFLAGTMDFDGKAPIGSLYCMDRDLHISRLENSMYIPNGMDWNPQCDSFFLTDTNKHVIYKYDYDIETGKIKNRRDFIVFGENEFPDGMCIDANGHLWVAMWNGARISRFDAEGKKVEDIPLPVQYPTSCCFGGDDMSTLLITTSILQLTEKEKKDSPLAGRVLAFETDATGQYMKRFKG